MSDSVTPWTLCDCQFPLSMEFFRQEYWSGLPFPSPGDLPNLGIEPGSPTLQAESLLSEPPGKPYIFTLSVFKGMYDLGQTWEEQNKATQKERTNFGHSTSIPLLPCSLCPKSSFSKLHLFRSFRAHDNATSLKKLLMSTSTDVLYSPFFLIKHLLTTYSMSDP